MSEASAIEEILLLATNARGPASVVDLISGALARPDLFVFGELLSHERICQLKDDSEVRLWYAALQLFAYGIWEDYTTRPESYPVLSSEQKLKLKQLTTVATVQKQQTTSYTDLKAALDMSEVRELEDFLITHCLYTGIIQGKIDQEQGIVVVTDSIKRDIRVQDIPVIKAKLNAWVATSEKCLENVLNRIAFTKEIANATEIHRQELVKQIDEKCKRIKESEGGMIREDHMETLTATSYSRNEGREVKTRRSNLYV